MRFYARYWFMAAAVTFAISLIMPIASRLTALYSLTVAPLLFVVGVIMWIRYGRMKRCCFVSLVENSKKGWTNEPNERECMVCGEQVTPPILP